MGSSTLRVTAGTSPASAVTSQSSVLRAGDPGNRQAKATGTSFAAPLVASRFALKMARPDVTAFQRAHQELRNEAIDLGPQCRDEIFGYGFLDAQSAAVVNATMSAR